MIHISSKWNHTNELLFPFLKNRIISLLLYLLTLPHLLYPTIPTYTLGGGHFSYFRRKFRLKRDSTTIGLSVCCCRVGVSALWVGQKQYVLPRTKKRSLNDFTFFKNGGSSSNQAAIYFQIRTTFFEIELELIRTGHFGGVPKFEESVHTFLYFESTFWMV